MFRKASILAASLLLTSATACPALAEQISRVVQYRDLNLSSPADARILRHRLRHAVDHVCRAPDPASPLTGTQDQDCRAAVMAKVQPEMLVAIELAQARAANQTAAR